VIGALGVYGTVRELATSGVSWLIIAPTAPVVCAVSAGAAWLLNTALHAACAVAVVVWRTVAHVLAAVRFVVGGAVGLLVLGWRAL
jgi:hypothetical protein